MDFVKNAIGGGGSEEQKKEGESNESGSGFMDKINTMAGGGKASEKDEDALDKGIHPPPKAVPPPIDEPWG